MTKTEIRLKIAEKLSGNQLMALRKQIQTQSIRRRELIGCCNGDNRNTSYRDKDRR